MYISREVFLHKAEFVKRGEGSVCSFLPVSYFICNCGGLLIFCFLRPVWIKGNLVGYGTINSKRSESKHPSDTQQVCCCSSRNRFWKEVEIPAYGS